MSLRGIYYVRKHTCENKNKILGRQESRLPINDMREREREKMNFLRKCIFTYIAIKFIRVFDLTKQFTYHKKIILSVFHKYMRKTKSFVPIYDDITVGKKIISENTYLALHFQSEFFFCFVRHRQDSTSRRRLSGLFRTVCK